MEAAALQTEVHALREQNAALQQKLADAHREITRLRQKLDALARHYFGKKSEQLDAAQRQLLLQIASWPELAPAPASAPAPTTGRRAPTPSQRLRTPENLDVGREVIEPEVVRAEPPKWKCISQEVSRLLDDQPGKFFWRETVRPKYVRLEDRSLPPVIAPAPVRVADGCLAAPGLLAQLLVSKYAD